MHPVLSALLVSVAVNAAFFAYAAVRKTDTVTDLSYSLSFAAVAIASLIARGAYDPFRLAAVGMVLAWATRLGAYLLARILKNKVDHRFDGIREKPLKFARFWALQALTVAVVSLPLSIALSYATIATPNATSLLGAALWLMGLILETAADAQKSAFKRRAEAGFIRSGLWAWSRHPNYFGETLAWTGFYVYCLPALGPDAILALASPVGIAVLLLFVSGIPPLEKAADRKYGGRDDYDAYKRSVSVFVPWPPRRKK